MQTAEHVLEAMRHLGEKGLPLTRVYRQLFNRNLYLAAYAKLYQNEGAMTKGVDDDTIDGMSLERIDAIIEDLRHERFRFAPLRRVWREKKDGKKRPIGISNFSSKLVQEVLRGILEAYYEPQFSENSHGFRPEKGCHTALSQIRQQFKASSWFIEGDIKACFDTIDHECLLTILAEKIKDGRVLNLIRAGLKAGVMEDWVYNANYSGTPQGGVLSPLLANIYLNQLDQYLDKTLLPQWNIGKDKQRNPKYRQFEYHIEEAKKQGDKERLKQLLLERREIPSKDVNDPNFRRLRYVRYADDFILSFIGSHAEAEAIKSQIADFLRDRLKLQLNTDKTLITSGRRGKALFLGYAISILQSDTKLSKGLSQSYKRRSINGSVRLGIPFGKVQEKAKPFMAKGKPIHRTELLRNSVAEIIQQYQTEYRGLVNYYKYAEDLCRLNSLMFVIEGSLVKTLAHKLKITVSKVYRKYRADKTINGQSYKVLMTTVATANGQQEFIWGAIPLQRHKGRIAEPIDDKIRRYKWSDRSELISRIMTQQCELCGKQGKVEVHHIRKLKDLKKKWAGRKEKPAWVKRMIALERKTLVLCPTCHREIHQTTKTQNLRSSS
jgi:group II intron reverse transcriptase/maturase